MNILSPPVGDIDAVSTRILIAEPELLLAELLGGHLERILPAASITRIRTVEALRSSHFDLAIVDLVLADGDVVEWLKSRSENGGLSKVIVLTSCEKEVLLHSVLHSAVAGVVHKADSLEFFDIALRTVLAGDDEGSKEWNRGRIPHDEDEPGDDDVEVTLPKTGQISVRYLPL